MTIPCQVGGRKGHLERFRWNTVAGGRQRRTPGTLSLEYRARWTAGKGHLEHFCGNSVPGGRQGDATWNAFAGIPWQVGGGKGHLERFRGKTVAGGKQGKTPGTLSQEFRARWAAGKDTWYTFAGKPWQVGGGKGHLERFRGKTVAGGRRERLPGTLLREYCARWTAGKGHLEHFCGNTVPGGQQGKDTWNAFAGKPWQVGGGKGYLERFCGKTVAGGRRERLPGTLSRGYRGRWEAGRDT